MRVLLDGRELAVPAAGTLAELLGGIEPLIEPGRLVTDVRVDTTPADATDARALAGWRLRPEATVQVTTETPTDFVRSRRQEMGVHLRRIADLLAAASDGLTVGAVADGNRRLATATRELRLVLELDQHLAVLEQRQAACAAVTAVVDRIGPALTAAEEERRWPDVAALLRQELVPALRASADQSTV